MGQVKAQFVRWGKKPSTDEHIQRCYDPDEDVK